MSIAEKLLRAKDDIDRAYSAGLAAGGGSCSDEDIEVAYQEGYTEGRKIEHNIFWDNFQQNGERTNYDKAFANSGWTDTTFRPKHKIYATTYTFADGVDNTKTSIRCGMTDLRPETIGVEIDWSQNTVFTKFLTHTPVKYVGAIDMSNATSVDRAFYNANALEEVGLVILPTSALSFGAMGFSARVLKEIRFSGMFMKSVAFDYASNLSLDSAKDIITHLMQNPTEALTVKFHASTWNLLNADLTAPSGGTWRSYIQSLGWTPLPEEA